ncbi:hypothetical protein [Streptomyces sp. NBC_01803]|uniref:hypothetical protein n=1 Tax=Streptomyces sp. NBC_01803 TaxID=2975946 RepID=UPI002DD9E45E|nr:hypothetical protein [Streptomyces sp. NBC_01803]WSA42785.1 hypothetical protein OIE51_00320 [Streptomyces sp. NBC_01803]
MRVRRNPLFFTVPIILLALAALLLVWEIVTSNLPLSMRSSWPWKLKLLDVQSATAATTIAAGLAFARAQYASAVRPILGWQGRVVKTTGLSSELVWRVSLVNGASAVAMIHSPYYRITLRAAANSSCRDSSWIPRGEAISFLQAMGLILGEDFLLRHVGPAYPISTSPQSLAAFTPRAMAIIDEMLIRVEVTDQVGDSHRRIIHCMRGVIREPTEPTME